MLWQLFYLGIQFVGGNKYFFVATYIKMVKVRFDIVVATFLVFILVILGNAFVNINKSFFKTLDEEGSFIGYPAIESTLAVTNLEQLAIATEYGERFAIVVDSDKIEATNYYSQLNGSRTVKKMSRFSIWFNRALNGSYYDRMYIVELEDDQFVPVLMMDGVIDMSEEMVILPVGETEFLSEKTDYLEELGEKYDLIESDAEQWYVNASGKDLTIFTDYKEKAEALKTTNWTIIGVSIALYAVISTVCMAKSKRKVAMERSNANSGE